VAKTTRREFLKSAGAAGAGILAGGVPRLSAAASSAARTVKPNIILIVGDDLGRSELGCYGQEKIRTPHIDRLAAEGIRFTQFYSGSPVCAPSRCVLMTGLHSGHAFIRDNKEVQPEGQLPIPPDSIVLPRLLKAEGYATGAMGKWGLGHPGSGSEPHNMGFDLFYGYNCQRHAHNYYPAYLWRNGAKETIEGNDGKSATGEHYAPDLFEREALAFIRANRDRPFFLFYPTTVPHLALQVPEDSLAEYRGKWPETPYDGKNGYLPHPAPRAAYAAMVTRFDRSVGRILGLVKELGLDDNTLVLFTSDNGSTYDIGGYDPGFFKGTGPLRDAKGSISEGGIRVPLIARWPGRIWPGRTTPHISGFQDFLPTILDAAGGAGRIPRSIDGLSFLPTLTGMFPQTGHSYFYMEFAGYGGQVMVRTGEWKAVRRNLLKDPGARLELYDLSIDEGEQNDVGGEHPELSRRARVLMRESHRPSREFPIPALDDDGRGPGF
jgi:arylsulfatase A